MQDLGLDDVLDLAAVRRFIEGSLEFSAGGFRAAMWGSVGLAVMNLLVGMMFGG